MIQQDDTLPGEPPSIEVYDTAIHGVPDEASPSHHEVAPPPDRVPPAGTPSPTGRPHSPDPKADRVSPAGATSPGKAAQESPLPGSAQARPAPAQPASAQSAPVGSTPARSAPAQSVPAGSAHARTTPARPTPDKPVPAPARPASPARPTSAGPIPTVPVPGKPASARPVPAKSVPATPPPAGIAAGQRSLHVPPSRLPKPSRLVTTTPAHVTRTKPRHWPTGARGVPCVQGEPAPSAARRKPAPSSRTVARPAPTGWKPT